MADLARSPKVNFINFPDLIKETIEFIKKHKRTVLILALIISLTGTYINASSGGGGGTNFSGNSSSSYNNNSSSSNGTYFDKQFEKTGLDIDSQFNTTANEIGNFVGSITGLITVISVCGFILLLVIVFTYFNYVSNIALIRFVHFADKGDVKDIKTLWTESKKQFWNLFVLMIIFFFISLGMAVVSIFLLCFICIGWILLIMLGYAMRFVSMMATRYVILENMQATEAIKKAFQELKNEYTTVLYFSLYTILINLVYGIVILIPILIISFLTGVLWIATQSWIIAIPGVILLVIVAYISSIAYTAFWSVFDTKVYNKFNY
jgi:hypothetical protein